MRKRFKLFILIIILCVVLCFIYYKEKKPIEIDNDNISIENKNDEAYFNDYVKVFQNSTGNSFLFDIDSFDDTKISYFIYCYYVYYKNDNLYELDDFKYIDVSYNDINELIKKYFNISNYNLKDYIYGNDYVKKITDDTYQIRFKKNDFDEETYKLSDIEKVNDGIILTYDVKGEDNAIQKIYLGNDKNYYVKKIEVTFYE